MTWKKRSPLLATLSQRFEVAPHVGALRQPPRCSPFTDQINEVGVIGSVVEDLYLQPVPGQPPSSKTTCTKSKQLGGGAVNVARAMAHYRGQPKPIFLIGKDCAGTEATQALRAEFPRALCHGSYEETRLSLILPDGKCLTTRPALNLDRATEPVRALLSTLDWTVVAPFGCEDTEFVEDLLGIAPRTVLMLSKDQLRDRDAALRLMRAASRVVLNHEEAEAITGHTDAGAAIDVLLAEACHELVITTPYGAEAYLDGQRESRPAIAIDRVRQTVGAGDRFTGVAVAAWSAGFLPAHGLDLGLAAAARHLAQLPPLGNLADLAAWADSQPKVSPPVPTTVPAAKSKPFRTRPVVTTGVSLALACTLLLAAFV